jgi:hypothetical protein
MTELAKPPSSKNRSEWRNPLVIAMLIYYVVMAVVGLWIPDNILKDNPGAREFSDFMAKIVPQIDRITALNIKPDVNRFYFSVLWAGSPVFLILAMYVIFQGRRHSYPMWVMPLQKAALQISGLLFLFLWSSFLWGVDPNMRLSQFLFGFSASRSFAGQLVFCTASVFGFAGALVWITAWLTGYIPRNIREQASKSCAPEKFL